MRVLADETRPFLQGSRLTAWELCQDGIPVTVVTDGMAGHLMAHGEVDLVIVGADRIAANGDVANKIGTYPLAVLAREHGIPFYVAAPTSDRRSRHARRRRDPHRGAQPARGARARGSRLAPPGAEPGTRPSTSRPHAS